jgi:glycosyltransferase involved in cell wall biosynthesis
VRTAQLEGALSRAGHRVSQVWLDPQNSQHPQAFQSRDELRSFITKRQPDAILVSNWELLGLLPFELAQPVIVDFVAPRPLELLFEHPEQVSRELRLLQSNLSKCDLLLTANDAQRDLLRFTLLGAGLDLRGCEPVLVVPLAAEAVGGPESDPAADGWTFVGGGVSWPWRKSDEYWHALQTVVDESGPGVLRLVLFGGHYRWHQSEPDSVNAPRTDEITGTGKPQTHSLEPYSHFSYFLRKSAHVGLEVAQYNIERQHSQSFRSLEFLRHGLPLICNDYLPIAALINQYDAGWTVNAPGDLPGLLKEIMTQPQEWKTRSANALQLVREVLHPDIAAKPLLDWLDMPVKAPQLPGIRKSAAPVVLGRPPLFERIRRQSSLLKQLLLSRLFGPPPGSEPGDNILIVTRRDLFPADHGGAVKIVETAKALSRHGRKVGIVSDDRHHWWVFEDGQKTRRRLPLWLRLLSLPRSLARLLHFSKNLPRSNAFLYLPLTDGGFFWHCLYAGKKLNPGILQAEFPAYAKPCIEAREILNAAVVLVEHNVEYARLGAQVKNLDEAQFKNLQAIEVDLCNRSDAVICVSDNDRAQLLQDGVKPALMHTIPHGFDPEPYKLPAVTTLRRDFGLPADGVLIAFHGTFSYPPNLDALHVFAQVLLPQLESAGRPFHVISIGRNPPAQSPHPNIHFTGSVAEVGPWLKACDLAVIPLREGGGTRMKIIDCFAAGLPVISTSKGIEGIPVVNGREAVISDDWLSMTNQIIELANSDERREQLVAAATEFAAGMDWFSITRRYLDVYSEVHKLAS